MKRYLIIFFFLFLAACGPRKKVAKSDSGSPQQTFEENKSSNCDLEVVFGKLKYPVRVFHRFLWPFKSQEHLGQE